MLVLGVLVEGVGHVVLAHCMSMIASFSRLFASFVIALIPSLMMGRPVLLARLQRVVEVDGNSTAFRFVQHDSFHRTRPW
jgi:hypothetical protein